MNTSTAPTFAMPGTWSRLDLRSDAAMLRGIRRIADQSFGSADELASLRHEFRAMLTEIAETSRTQHAVDLYFAREITPGVPMPVSLAVFLPEIDDARFSSLGVEELRTAVSAVVSQPGDEKNESVPLATVVQAARRTRVRTVPESEHTPRYDLLQADYWLAAARPNRIALLSFSTALADFEEEMLELFDAIVKTVRWTATAPAEVHS